MKHPSGENRPFFERFSASSLAGEVRHTLKTWPLRGFFALLDQGLISGSNFVVAILLARWLAPRQYGAYALAFEVFLFVAVVYSALILEPTSVFGPSVYKNDFPAYMDILLRVHWVLSGLVVVALFAVAGVLGALKPESPFPHALVGVALASPCLLLFWLARRGFYIHLLPGKAALGACVYSAVTLAGVAMVYRLRLLSSLSAFLVMAAGAVVTGPVMLRWLKSNIPAAAGHRLQFKDVVRQHWSYGRWALGSSVAIWFAGAIYYPLLGSFFTLAETGKFKALMNISSPIGQMFVALSLLSLPHASRSHHEKGAAVTDRLAWKLTVFYIGGTSLYWLIVMLARVPIVHHLYGGKYVEITALLPWVALGSILRIAATAQTIVLKARRLPAKAFAAYFAAGVVAILAGVPLTRWLGIRGALLGMVFSSAVAVVVAVAMIRSKSNPSDAPAAVSAKTLALREEVSVGTQG